MTDEIEMTALPSGEIEVAYEDGSFVAASWSDAVKRIVSYADKFKYERR